MEEDQEVKHVCKFCSKSFPCGRSLGGHMRSHVTTNTNASTEVDKLSSFSINNNCAGGGDSEGGGANNGGSGGYGLRENPKKTWRFTDSSEDNTTLVLDKLCKECGKGFHSWKALFGHMKCHSERFSQNINSSFFLEDQDSWNDNTNASQKMDDSHSENEATASNRRRRSKRRRTRYMVPSTSSVSLVSEAEQEQEEVAMSLMMLSRDVSPWCGLNSVNSLQFGSHSLVPTNLDSKVEGRRVIISNGSEKKLTKPKDMKWEFGNLDGSNLKSKGKMSSELLDTESPGRGFGVNKTMVSIHGKDKKAELDSNSVFEDNGTDDNSNSKYTSIKAKFMDSELKSSPLKTWGNNNKAPEGEFSKSSNKRGKFECTTCKKIFHSYQALGGHRASHKKIKGCFASRNESSENSTELEAELSPDPTTEKLLKNEYVEEHEVVTANSITGFDNVAETVRESKKGKGHECPICLKVFPSGQALGGHKRSHHLAGGSESVRNYQSQTVVLEGASPEIRDFFDLNLPASTEEEGNSSRGHGHAEPYRPWWVVGGSHKQEALVGLISN